MAAGDFTGVVGWLFLPKFAASCTLTGAHWMLQRVAPQMVPHPNTSRYALHQRLSYVFVIFVYLVYTLVDTERNLGSNYYHILGLNPRDFSQLQLRQNFRRLSLVLHPDKNPGGEKLFIAVQNAYKILSDPVSRFVYDHAGLEAVACQTCMTVNDYILASIPRRIAMFLMTILGIVALQVLRIGAYGTYWRYIAVGSFLALEVSMMTRTTEPAFIRLLLWLIPNRTSFEIAQILRQLMVCIFIGLNQIGPQFVPVDSGSGNTVELAKSVLSGVKAIETEVVSNTRRTVGMFKGTGLERKMVREFEKEMTLGMTMGVSQAFRNEYTDRLNAERSNLTS
ncbi:hypothetical protein LPJ73_000466 [Coemansia sp. RSA 2703]|nr:hypothetical protein LPJ73_000466 [Coemansia sp. RSA 2703]KAJ2378151.1 hypothetical protein IW150_000971 [Coemansia sp. RSA 2607]KAJ2398206.1 hypothetical protein GGI05_000225 [Coemansia sp. RSA 2603]